jgi:patatin-like phospholipase/acyl hydrolase
MTEEKSTRILSIDGGGIKGLVVLKQLEFFEHILKKPLYKYFDTITGTSTGGIIAVLLSLGYSVKSIREFYEIHGENIFDKRPLRFGLLRSKYSDKYFNDILKTHLKDYRLSDCKTNIVIPAYNITKNRLDIFTKTDVDFPIA